MSGASVREASAPPAPSARASAALTGLACAAAALVVLRTLPLLAFEFIFDSDQAIVGLMAKHLSEGRTFPLFFYGQNYMLGVQAWMAAPFYWLGGPTLTMLRAPLMLINATVAVVLVAAIARRGVRPVHAFVAALPFVATSPAVSAELMFTLGASVEPFLYVLCLWALRRRPAAFGALACFGMLHREFTVFALSAFAVAGWHDWRAWRATGFARAGAAFAGVWLVVNQLKLRINTYGPGGGVESKGSLLLQVETVLKRLSFDWDGYVGRLGDVVTRGLPDIFGAGPRPLADFTIRSTISQGHDWAALLFAVALAVALVRLLWSARRPAPADGEGGRFFLYLALVAIGTILAYGLGGGLPVGSPVVLAYVLFALLLPVGVLAWFFQREPGRHWRAGVAVAVTIWAVSNLWDNGRLLHEYVTNPPRNHHRVMANFLMAKGVTHGRAVYWDAYVITFLSREQVIVSPDEVIRISAYKADVDAHAARAVTLMRQPCDRGAAVDVWCVTDAQGQPPW
jgi:hypothetical protein